MLHRISRYCKRLATSGCVVAITIAVIASTLLVIYVKGLEDLDFGFTDAIAVIGIFTGIGLVLVRSLASARGIFGVMTVLVALTLVLFTYQVTEKQVDGGHEEWKAWESLGLDMLMVLGLATGGIIGWAAMRANENYKHIPKGVDLTDF